MIDQGPVQGLSAFRPRATAAALLLAATCLTTPSLGWAQAASAPPAPETSTNADTREADATQVEEVVVTARRVQEDLQTTPVAVTAITGQALERQQITNVETLQYSVPNLTVAPLLGGTGSAITIRGQVGAENVSSSDQAVGVYVDGVYLARSSGGLLDLVDVERVEVLRGPQGTLFGRNTTGGAINIVSPDPSGIFSGRLTGRVGNYDLREVQGAVNIPFVGEEFGARISFRHSEHDGYGESLTTGQALADANSDFIRAVIRADPDGQIWDITIAGDYYRNDTSGPIAALTGIRPGSVAASLNLGRFIPTDFYDSFNQRQTFQDTEVRGLSATINVDLGFATLTSISAVRDVENNALTDADGSPLPLLEFSADLIQEYQISQELQLTGVTGDLNWIVGGFYFREENTDRTLSSVSNTFGFTDNESQAVYGQATYSFTPQLRLTLGARYTEDQRGLDLATTRPNGSCAIPVPDVPGVCLISREGSFDYISYTAGLDYQYNNDVFLYVKTSRGFRSGGFNARGDGTGFEPEEVTDYEAGIKIDFFDRRLRTNLAAFYTDYQNVQRTVVTLINGTPSPLTLNAAEAHIPGVELEVSAVPTENLRLGFTLGIIRPEYDEYIDPLQGDLSDFPFLNVSEETYSVRADYTIPFSNSDILLHADYGYQSERFYAFNRTTPQDLDRQEGYGILNASITYRLNNPDVSIGLFGRNITEEDYNTYILDLYGPFGFTTAYRGTPRTYGAEVTLRF